ncbi:MAG: hypothetical protein JWQ42_25 [Edaphobacter sp.]|nr:hypothetical protein [Edaphobacter sp.]
MTGDGGPSRGIGTAGTMIVVVTMIADAGMPMGIGSTVIVTRIAT